MELKDLAKLIAEQIRISTSVVDELNPNHVISDGHFNFLGSIERNIHESLPAILWVIKNNPEVLDMITQAPKPKNPEPLRFDHLIALLDPSNEIQDTKIHLSQREAVKFVQQKEAEGFVLLGCWPPLIAPYKKPKLPEEGNPERERILTGLNNWRNKILPKTEPDGKVEN